MSTRGALALIAGVVFALGVVLALLPVSLGDGIGCGSAISGSDKSSTSEASLADYRDDIADAYVGGGYENTSYVAQCEDRVGTQRLIAFPLVGVGALGLAFLGLTSPYMREFSERPARSDR